MGADEQANVGRLQGAVDRPLPQQGGIAQELSDVAGHLQGQAGAQFRAAGQACLRFVRLGPGRSQPEQLQWRLPVSPPARFGLQAGHVQPGARQASGAELVHGGDQFGAGAPVVPHRIAGVRHGAGREIGLEIAAAEAVDRLLGIANHHQQMATAAEGQPQDSPLDGIGVLKFIDQGGAVALGHRSQQGRGGCGVRAWIEVAKQLGVGAQAQALAPSGQLPAPPVAAMEQDQLSGTIHQIGHGLHQRTLNRQGIAPLRRPGHLAKGAGVEKGGEHLLPQHRLVTGPAAGLVVARRGDEGLHRGGVAP